MRMEKQKNFMDWDKPGLAVITGASSGIGLEFASRLAEQGFNLLLVARRKERLEQLSRELNLKCGVTVEVYAADLTKMDEIRQLTCHLGEINEIDILINNAGFASLGLFSEADIKKLLDMQMVHNTAPILLTRAVLPAMVKRDRGVIIFTASVAAFTALPVNGLYTPTKAFLVGLAECLAIETYRTNIRVQALCPGLTRTEFHDVAGLHNINDHVPKKMWQTTGQVVRASLSGARKRKSVVIPGILNRILAKWIHRSPQAKMKTQQDQLKREQTIDAGNSTELPLSKDRKPDI